MANVINPQISPLSPATGTESTPSPNTSTGPAAIGNAPGTPDLRKFNALTSTRSSGPRGILGRPMVGNVGEINAGGVRGTPGDLVERILEHEPPLGLLNEAMRA